MKREPVEQIDKMGDDIESLGNSALASGGTGEAREIVLSLELPRFGGRGGLSGG